MSKDIPFKYNPELRPKSHDLKVSFWVGEEQPHNILDQDKVEEFFKGLGFKFCGSGFDFEERRRDIEFKKQGEKK